MSSSTRRGTLADRRSNRFLEAGGWRLEAGGWRLEAGGWTPMAGLLQCQSVALAFGGEAQALVERVCFAAVQPAGERDLVAAGAAGFLDCVSHEGGAITA